MRDGERERDRERQRERERKREKERDRQRERERERKRDGGTERGIQVDREVLNDSERYLRIIRSYLHILIFLIFCDWCEAFFD